MSRLSNAMHQQKLACWKQIIIDCRTSGLTDTEYLRRQGINRSQFYYWLRQIREELLDEHPECLHPCKLGKTSKPEPEAPEQDEEASSPETLPAETLAAHPAPIAQNAPLSPVPRPAEFVSVRVPAPLPRDKLMVSCGPFQFELTEDTPVPLIQKLAAAWRDKP